MTTGSEQSRPTDDPPDTDPETPRSRSSQRIAAVHAPICTCLAGDDIEALAARAGCAVHGEGRGR